jgi:hypothetical protein
VSSAKTVEALREAYKAVMNAGQLKTEIEIADESTGEKERMEFQQYLYRRSDALAHSKSAGAAAGEAGGEGGNR